MTRPLLALLCAAARDSLLHTSASLVLGLVIGANPRNMSLTLPSVGRFPSQADWTNGLHQVKAAGDLAADTLSTP